MWRHIWLIVGLLCSFSSFGCSLDNTPKRLGAYLPQPSAQARSRDKNGASSRRRDQCVGGSERFGI